MKKLKRIVTLILALLMMCSLLSVSFADGTTENTVYIPVWMQPNTVIVYDDELNYTVIQGGELTPADMVGRTDIAAAGATGATDELIATQNIKVEYDLHGFIQNIYYPVPGASGEYQLSNPIRSRVGSGILDEDTIYTYPTSYYNYDTQAYQYCTLTRSTDGNTMIGRGRITFYTGTFGEGGTHTLVAYDCATKKYKDDVSAGTRIYAKNTYANKSAYYYKYDVGGMPGAILDIWSDSSVNPITDITNNGTVDNVYSGYISHVC